LQIACIFCESAGHRDQREEPVWQNKAMGEKPNAANEARRPGRRTASWQNKAKSKNPVISMQASRWTSGE